MINQQIPLLGIVAHSGTGKTTLLKQLIPYLRQRGIRTGLIKHTHHDVDVDTPGKDSFELRKAGADQTMVASSSRWALMTEMPEQDHLNLDYLATRFDRNKLDMIFVEGFKHEEIDKIVLHREGTGGILEQLIDIHAVAVASDCLSETISTTISVLNINKIEDVGEFVIRWLENQQKQ
ncbi:molybdopterin-guanine dinucleotide biosynthesis protein B [Rahnella aceris]|jgi:molybdopterin-guanine dinucleotide biosynthesis protein B|uniref:Molybdopterin-guanine dinucleotide biosynthesis protein B n=1 Tax=Rahnella sp. (strain Y9602) TaxID=2703885 RepID=A0A0H3FGI9_RAHSY|nr:MULTISPECIES: molybdopterin-guanine dinucleotide biosynthesis protein MobB [Rahnella]ADW75980.1 molybdopterin-guanine dinucleotide biosynthesis protein B [Rahnella aceris]AFE60670.1 molybdopterin-guanine dinucleotide biosynthesis protein B [Rahnella aquatilis HX2]MBU9861986.1 molybdopterin-guanine dinucleotide biosynthesis protein B [Rahnella aceris]MQB55395.1 molybdopterin-guanine dinucleotide biosynthesis protein B [Rahnella sp. RcJ3]